MKIKRIGTLKTLRQYEKSLLEDVFPKYVSKAGVDEKPQEILSMMRLECHNPFFLSCVLLSNDNVPVGFFIAFIQITHLGKRLYIDHMYAPNTGQAAEMYWMIQERMGVEDVLFMTRRSPDAWIKLFRKNGKDVRLHGYLIRTSSKDAGLGEEK